MKLVLSCRAIPPFQSKQKLHHLHRLHEQSNVQFSS
jgi:hypothetical protein